MREYRDIKGYEGRYQISKDGFIKSLARKVVYKNGKVYNRKVRLLKICFNTDGYPVIGLYKKNKSCTYRVHRLVAEAFIPNPENKTDVNHIDGIKTNNQASNLEWVTHQENVIHAYYTGLREGRKGENHHGNKLTERNVLEIRDIWESHDNKLSQGSIAEMFNVSQGSISAIVKKYIWKHI